MTVASAAALLELPKVPGMTEADALPPLAWQYHPPVGGEKRGDEEQAIAGAIGH